jgi:hypothetical protein
MEAFKDDVLGFGSFLIDEQVVSLLNQLTGGYVRLTLRARKDHLPEMAHQYKQQFDKIAQAKRMLHVLSYDQKIQEIGKYEVELKQVLEEERAR